MRTVLILLSMGILIVFADAQRKSNFSKPIINLDKRPHPPVWNRPPVERRKLSIFPKTNMKFVVTPKTVVNNDDEAKESLATKRPLMRKFVMQDRNDKGTWSFAPREPIMKPKRFTVTLAPPRIDNTKLIDEMKPEESKKLKTVADSPKTDKDLSKTYNLNKGNLIKMVQIKKVEPTVSKGLEKPEQKLVKAKVPELINVNDTHGFVDIAVNDNKTLQISYKNSEDYVIDEKNSNDDINLNVNETIYEDKNRQESIDTIQTTVAPDIEVASKDSRESRVLDVNDFDRSYDNNSLIADKKDNNDDKIEQVQSFYDLEILLKNYVNNTEEINMSSNFNFNDSLSVTKNETTDAIEDIPQFDVTQPHTFYDVISLTNVDKENIKQDGSVSIQDSQNIFNDDMKNEYFTDNAVDSGIVSNLENLMQLIEEEALDRKTDVIYLDNTEAREQIESFISKNSEIDIDSVETYTEEPATNSPIKSDVIDNFKGNDSEELKSEVSGEINPVFTDLNSDESFENKSLSSTEMSNESSVDEDINETFNESTNGYCNLTAEEIYSESNNMTDEDISNESIRDAANNYTEELFNESLIDKSNNLTGEEISNESSSNMAAEELSNESIVDKSNNLTEETSSELNETSNNFTGEEISHESDIVSDEWLSEETLGGSQNISGEGISDEALANRFKRSNNIIEEEYLASTISGFKYKGQETKLNHDLSYKNINA